MTVPAWRTRLFSDRIQINSILIVLCFVSVLILSSQSAASYPSYFLAISMLLTVRKWNDVFATGLIWFILGLLVYLCSSSLWSEPFSWVGTISIFIRGLLVFCFVVALAECQQRGQVQSWLGRALALAGGIVAILAIVNFLIAPPSDGRLVGLGQLDNSVVAGLILSIVLLLFLGMVLFDESRLWRLTASFCGIFVIIVIYLTGSRNAWASLAIGSAVLMLAHTIRDKRKFLASVVSMVLLIATALIAVYFSDVGRSLIFPRGDSYRIGIWTTVVNDISSSSLFFGRGILTPDQVNIDGRVFSHLHNMYLSVFFQGGAIGVFVFAAAVMASFRALYVNYQVPAAKLAFGVFSLALASYLLDGHELVDKVGETWFLFWLPVGIAVGVSWGQMRIKID